MFKRFRDNYINSTNGRIYIVLIVIFLLSALLTARLFVLQIINGEEILLVFTLKIQKGEIRQLRGLLFFTDGDGIFPPTAPSFDTAFVFLNHETEKHAIPDWGIRLNLNLPDVF